MTKYLRLSQDRGHAQHGWLDSYHSFSFGEYHDHAHKHFGPIRVINDDTVAGGGGFGAHPHADMEIMTYVTSGALAHKDSLGTGSVIKASDVQIMSAGTGIVHSEFNASEQDPVKFLQIWVIPRDKNLPPRYEQKTLNIDKGLTLIAAAGGSDTAVDIKQDISIYRWLGVGAIVLPNAHKTYIHVIEGQVDADDTTLGSGDALGLSEPPLSMKALGDQTHALIFVF